MGCEMVEQVYELPEPMNKEEFLLWESLNRPPGMTFLEESYPVGDEVRSAVWRCVYDACDDETASMLL